MSQVSTSIEILLKARAQGLEQVKAIEQAIGKVAEAQRGVAAQTQAAAGAAGAQGSALTLLIARSKALLGGLGLVQVLRGAVRESLEAQRIESRTLAVLQAQSASREEALDRLREAKGVAESINREIGTIGVGDALRAAASVLATGPQSAERLRQILLAAANLSAATGQGLQETAEQVAKSLNGVAPRDLINRFGELRREFERLGPAGFGQALRRGALIDFGVGRLGGAAAAGAATDAGLIDAARVRFLDALQSLGDAVRGPFASAVTGLTRSADVAAKALLLLATGGEEAAVRALQTTAGGVTEGLLKRLDDSLALLGPRTAAAVDNALGLPELRRGLDLLARGGAQSNPLAGTGGAAAAPSPRLFDNEQITALVSEQGLVDALSASLVKLREQYLQLGAAVNRDNPFEFFIENPRSDADALFNLAAAQARLRDVIREAGEAQEAFNAELARARDLTEAGTIGQPKANEIIQAAAERLRQVQQELNFVLSIASGDVERGLAFLRSLPDLPDALKTLATIPELPQAEKEVKKLGDTVEQTKIRFAGLADEIRERGRGPLAGFISDVAESKAGLEELPDVFRRVLLQIAAEAAASRILKALLGDGGGKDTGLFGGLFNSLGSILGFASGGLVPGPDRGYDSGIIAARGGEYMVRPEAVRRPGVLPFLDSINRGLPGYAAGGLVTRIADATLASAGAPGNGGGVSVLPVVVADRDNAQRLLAGQNGMAVIDALRRNPGAARKALGL